MTQIDFLINDVDAAYRRMTNHTPDGIDPSNWSWAVHQAASTIVWYVGTGRASMYVVRALRRCRLCSLIKAMAQADDHSDNGMIRSMHAYLDRNRKYGA